MSEQHPDHLGEGLLYEDNLPLTWDVVEDSPLTDAWLSVHETNESFLRRVSAMEEEPADAADIHPTLVKEIKRIESKLDVILDMVGTVLTNHLKLPSPIPIRLSADGMSWIAPTAPPVDARVLISQYFSARFPYPLILVGRVRSVEPHPHGRQTTVVFDDMGDAVQDWLEKTIFRQHRRRVALARRANAPDEAKD